MDYFIAKHAEAFCEEVALRDLADKFGTPSYIYSAATIDRHCTKFTEAFQGINALACFAVKANSNLSFLRRVFNKGFGADIVSIGELERALIAGADPGTIVFSGVGKQIHEINRALEVGILSFNVESLAELRSIETCAKSAGQVAPVSLRVNPNIDAKTNPKISTGLYSTKFGLSEADLDEPLSILKDSKHLSLVGLACHIGSQITNLEPLAQSAKRMNSLARKLNETGHHLQYLNMGGGLGIRYGDEAPPSLTEYAETLRAATTGSDLQLIIEPGRVVAGNTGILLTKVISVKKTAAKYFVVLDAAMNDLLRPSMYNSYHEILPVQGSYPDSEMPELVRGDFVGPICETGDFLGLDRSFPLPKAGDLFYVRACGAYAASMASQYNSRPRAPEIMVSGHEMHLVKPREKLSDLLAPEQGLLR